MEGAEEDYLLGPHQEEVVVGLLIGYAQTPLASRTAMGQRRVSVPNVELHGLVKKELTG